MFRRWRKVGVSREKSPTCSQYLAAALDVLKTGDPGVVIHWDILIKFGVIIGSFNLSFGIIFVGVKLSKM